MKKGRSATREKFFLATRTTGKDEGNLFWTYQLTGNTGDLVVWRQIIDRAIEAKKGVIFVNDDKKRELVVEYSVERRSARGQS